MIKGLKKYLQVFQISFSQEFAYKMNFVMWRVRNIIRFFLVFFLWDTAFNSNTTLFGYDKEKMITYVFGLLFVNAFVLSTRAQDVAGEISSGNVMNLIVRPINFFKYWLTRDFSTKALNSAFVVLEFTLLFVILKPPFFLQGNVLYLLSFLVALVLAILIYFLLSMMVSLMPFWYPEAGWGLHFLISGVIVQFFSGALFPIDVFPRVFQNIIYATPFPYLVFTPLQIYLGRVGGASLAAYLLIPLAWVILGYFLYGKLWRKGLIAYEAHGR
jgi:ABC-type uncharacterized transport system permease subunit